MLTPDHGFCSGVKAAVERAERVAREARAEGRPVFTLGPLVHNRHVVRALESLGVTVVRSPSEVPAGGVLVLPSHGVGPDIAAEARARGVAVRDATCPLVRRAQKAARELRKRGYEVVLVGQPDHAEVKSVAAWAGGRVHVVRDAAEALAVAPVGQVAVVSQTTQRPDNVAEVARTLEEAARGTGGEVLVESTLCHVTRDRQEQTRRLAAEVDVLVVVGGRESANTRRLVGIGREAGCRVHHVEAAEEIDPAWFRKGDRVGVTAGTSTPDWISEEVAARMKEIEPRAEAEEQPGPTPETSPSPEAGREESGPATMEQAAVASTPLEPGARVTGTVVAVEDKHVLVDIGYKTEGVLPSGEGGRGRMVAPLKVGDVIEARVVRVDEEGRPVLSRRRAEEEKLWRHLEETKAANATIDAPVTAVVKGGLVADVGTRGFIPASQVGLQFIRDLQPYVGKTLRVKVIEVSRSDRRVILSEKKALEEERDKAKSALLDSIREGATLTGEVKRVIGYGAFVDIGGIDGLLHVSEMSWKRVTDPREIVKEGDKVEVRVLKVDRERGRISLALRQAGDDPWAGIAERFPVGAIVTGKVVSVADFGAFVELTEGVEGLVHVSQLSDKRIGHPSEVVKVGDELRVKVLKVNPADRRISLSVRGAEEDLGRRQMKKFLKESKEGGDVVTIRDMVGDLLGGAEVGDKKDAEPEEG